MEGALPCAPRCHGSPGQAPAGGADWPPLCLPNQVKEGQASCGPFFCFQTPEVKSPTSEALSSPTPEKVRRSPFHPHLSLPAEALLGRRAPPAQGRLAFCPAGQVRTSPRRPCCPSPGDGDSSHARVRTRPADSHMCHPRLRRASVPRAPAPRSNHPAGTRVRGERARHPRGRARPPPPGRQRIRASPAGAPPQPPGSGSCHLPGPLRRPSPGSQTHQDPLRARGRPLDTHRSATPPPPPRSPPGRRAPSCQSASAPPRARAPPLAHGSTRAPAPPPGRARPLLPPGPQAALAHGLAHPSASPWRPCTGRDGAGGGGRVGGASPIGPAGGRWCTDQGALRERRSGLTVPGGDWDVPGNRRWALAHR